MRYCADERVGQTTFRSPYRPTHRLVWFPFGGGSGHSFSRAAAAFPPDWEICAIDAPGHPRTRGPAVSCLNELAELYFEALKPAFFEDAVLVGHSVGALVAAKLAHELERRSRRARALVVCASPPPPQIDAVEKLSPHSFSEAFEWWRTTMVYDEGFGDDGAFELFEAVYPAMKSDHDLFESAKSMDLRCRATPTLVIGGDDDSACPWAANEAWKTYTNNVDLRRVPGGHLFILQFPDAAVRAIVDFVDAASAA